MIKILVIDDIPDNLISIKALLKIYLPNCAVITSQSGKEGIYLAKTKNPDVILLDIIMPKMDGYAACTELKNNAETKHIPIIMLTAIKTDMESRVKGMDLGADAFLSKPIDPVELTAQVKVILRIKATEDELRQEKRDLELLVSERTSKLSDSYKNLKLEVEVSKQAEFKLKERLKELNCLYGISKIIETSDLSLEEIFQRIVSLVPTSWQYPELTVCRIIIDDIEYKELNFKKTHWMQSSELKVSGKKVGTIDVCYLVEMPRSDEGPFMKEERLLINAVAERLGRVIERKRAETKEKKHHSNIDFLSKTAMQFVEFPQDGNIYDFVGKQIRDMVGKDSYIVVNSVDRKTGSSTIHSVLGIGKFAKIIANKLGRNPVGMKFDIDDLNIHYQDGRLHVYHEGLYGISLKTVPKSICKSIEKIAGVNTIYVIDLAKQEQFFGSVVIFLKEKTGKLKNKQLIETFIKQASIAILNKEAEEALKTSESQLSNAMKIAKLAYWGYDVDSDLFTFNDHFYDIFRTTVETVGGYTMSPAQYAQQFLHPDDMKRLAIELNKAFQTTDPNYSLTIEHRIIYADGEIGYIAVRFYIEKDGKGRTIKIFGANQDITEQKLIEKEIIAKTEALEKQFKKSENQRKANLVILNDLNDTTKILKKEVTEREKAEVQVKKDLVEKNTLLQELYHRTKNNMQIILSLLRIESRKVNDENLTKSFKDITSKISTMALVHHKLYQAQDLSRVNLKNYISDLVHIIRKNYSIQASKVSIRYEMDDVSVLIDTVMPLGLALNELISNIYKHAFPGNKVGEIAFKLQTDSAGLINLEISDNGVGLSKDMDLRDDKYTGMSTMFSLVEHQLQGEIEYQSDNGLHWSIKIDDSINEERV